jgi:flagellar biosynthesis/type III secretory pathway protein FliH
MAYARESGYEQGLEKGLEQGMEKGMEKGREEERARMAEELRKQGIPEEIIARVVGESK